MSNYTPEQIASLQKERPKNETEKRFVLSSEEFSKERLAAVKTEMDEMQAKYPEVLSLCLFGSMVKGTAHEGSDIDGYLFVDSGVIAENEKIPEDEILKRHEKRNSFYFTEEKDKKYSGEFREGIKEKTGLADEFVEHIRSLPISEKVISDEIATMQNYYRNVEVFKVEKEKWIASKPPRGSEIEDLLNYQRAKPEEPKFISPNLGPMFHLDVGGGIRKYRKLFVEKINQLGADGERIWKDTIRGTESLENNFSMDPTKRYPRTLAEAVEMYDR